MTEICFSVPGKPQGKDRPRFDSIRKRTYTTTKTKQYESLVQICGMESVGDRYKAYKEGIAVEITAFYAIPKGTSKKKRELMLSGEIRPTVKPDLDNIAKAILDALNGVAYYDDNQVQDLTIKKFYSDDPRVDVKIIYKGEEE